MFKEDDGAVSVGLDGAIEVLLDETRVADEVVPLP